MLDFFSRKELCSENGEKGNHFNNRYVQCVVGCNLGMCFGFPLRVLRELFSVSKLIIEFRHWKSSALVSSAYFPIVLLFFFFGFVLE